jgi:hypothetical protein
MKASVKFIAFACMLLCGARAHGEKELSTLAELYTMATHVIVGNVQAIYTRMETKQGWETTHYLAEIRPTAVEKGTGISTKRPVYVRYWDRRWVGDPNDPPDDTHGHWRLPAVKDNVRVYVARNAYDGFTSDNNDGGFNVIGVNGFVILDKR